VQVRACVCIDVHTCVFASASCARVPKVGVWPVNRRSDTGLPGRIRVRRVISQEPDRRTLSDTHTNTRTHTRCYNMPPRISCTAMSVTVWGFQGEWGSSASQKRVARKTIDSLWYGATFKRAFYRRAARVFCVFQGRLKVTIFSTLDTRRGGAPLINVTLGQCSQSNQAGGGLSFLFSRGEPHISGI